MATTAHGWPYVVPADAVADYPTTSQALATKLEAEVTALQTAAGIGASNRNRIINGGFDVWQRGVTIGAGQYTADRWLYTANATTPQCARQTLTPGTLPDRAVYAARYSHVTTGGAGEVCVVEQRIESVATLAGKTATVSFYAKADAAKSVSVRLAQLFGTGGGPSASVLSAPVKVTLSTAWARYTVTIAVPSIAGKTLGTNGNDALSLMLYMSAGSSVDAVVNGQIGTQSGTFDFALVQVEEGSAATPFEFEPQAVTLTKCQRYYVRWSAAAAHYMLGVGQMITAAVANCVVPLPVAMRVPPTGGTSGVGSCWLSAPGSSQTQTGGVTPTAINYSNVVVGFQLGTPAAVSTAGYATQFGVFAGAGNYIDASAEL